MLTEAGITTIDISSKMLPLLDKIAGKTPNQKITYLLLDAIRRNLESCDREQLELEIKYGMEYAEFKRGLEAGALGDEFGYDLEMDAIRWSDLIAEKKHWLQQLSLIKASSR